MAYNFTAQCLKGANNNAPDALSRHPIWDPQPADTLAEQDVHNNPEMSLTELRAIRSMNSGDSESLHLQELRKHAEQDELLKQFILQGFTKCRKQPYWNVHQQLTSMMTGCRLLVFGHFSDYMIMYKGPLGMCLLHENKLICS